jgi:hypothetical protein
LNTFVFKGAVFTGTALALDFLRALNFMADWGLSVEESGEIADEPDGGVVGRGVSRATGGNEGDIVEVEAGGGIEGPASAWGLELSRLGSADDPNARRRGPAPSSRWSNPTMGFASPLLFPSSSSSSSCCPPACALAR